MSADDPAPAATVAGLTKAQADLIKQVERRGTREFGRLPAAEAPLIKRTRKPKQGESRG